MMQPKAVPVCSEASELKAVVLGTYSECGRCGSIAPAHIGAVERAVLVQGEVPFARGMLLVVVEPDFGGVVRLAAVDVEEFSGVGHGGDPVHVSKVIAKLGRRPFWSPDVPVLATAIPEWDNLWKSAVSRVNQRILARRSIVRSNECDRARGS